jgi:hypothetical protein
MDDATYNRRLGFWLRSARERAGLTQETAATELGLAAASKSTVSDWRPAYGRRRSSSFGAWPSSISCRSRCSLRRDEPLPSSWTPFRESQSAQDRSSATIGRRRSGELARQAETSRPVSVKDSGGEFGLDRVDFLGGRDRDGMRLRGARFHSPVPSQ